MPSCARCGAIAANWPGRTCGSRPSTGEADFAVGDRVQFTDTLKARGIYNGNVGTITGIDAETGVIRARLDARGRAGRARGSLVSVGIRGVPARLRGDDLQRPGEDPGPHLPVPHASLAVGGELRGADPAARERAGIRGAGDGARRGQLARQMARGEVRAASVAWATGEELAKTVQAQQLQAELTRPHPKLQPQPPARAPWQQQATAETGRGDAYRRSLAARARAPEDALQAKVREALQRRQRQAEQPAPAEETPREALRRELRALDWRGWRRRQTPTGSATPSSTPSAA